jgi:hypothetical protein
MYIQQVILLCVILPLSLSMNTNLRNMLVTKSDNANEIVEIPQTSLTIFDENNARIDPSERVIVELPPIVVVGRTINIIERNDTFSNDYLANYTLHI